MKKRLISTALALTMAIGATSTSVFNSNAMYFGNKEELEETMSSKYTHAPELTDVYFKSSDDVWVMSDNEYSMEFILEQVSNDNIFIFIKESCNIPEVSEIADLIGYKDNVSIKKIAAGLKIDFSSKNHELNYMICEKIVTKLKESYEISGCQASIGKAVFEHVRITIPGMVYASTEELKNKRLEEIASQNNVSEINKALVEKGINVRYTTDEVNVDYLYVEDHNEQILDSIVCKYALLPDDMTVKEKLEYSNFMLENYNVMSDYYNYCSTSMTQDNDINFSNIEIAYKEYDANEDGNTNIADATAIIQAIGNPDKYALTAQGYFNADTDGDGLTGLDAVAIQRKLAGI